MSLIKKSSYFEIFLDNLSFIYLIFIIPLFFFDWINFPIINSQLFNLNLTGINSELTNSNNSINQDGDKYIFNGMYFFLLHILLIIVFISEFYIKIQKNIIFLIKISWILILFIYPIYFLYYYSSLIGSNITSLLSPSFYFVTIFYVGSLLIEIKDSLPFLLKYKKD
jgi:hypothetical protein